MYWLNITNTFMYVQILDSFDEEVIRVVRLVFTLTPNVSFFVVLFCFVFLLGNEERNCSPQLAVIPDFSILDIL